MKQSKKRGAKRLKDPRSRAARLRRRAQRIIRQLERAVGRCLQRGDMDKATALVALRRELLKTAWSPALLDQVEKAAAVMRREMRTLWTPTLLDE